jgi:hypothetical protein
MGIIQKPSLRIYFLCNQLIAMPIFGLHCSGNFLINLHVLISQTTIPKTSMKVFQNFSESILKMAVFWVVSCSLVEVH